MGCPGGAVTERERFSPSDEPQAEKRSRAKPATPDTEQDNAVKGREENGSARRPSQHPERQSWPLPETLLEEGPLLAQKVNQATAGGAKLLRAPRGGDHDVDFWIVEWPPDDRVVAMGADLTLELERHRDAGSHKAQRCVDATRRRLVDGVRTQSAGSEGPEDPVELGGIVGAWESDEDPSFEIGGEERGAGDEHIGDRYRHTDPLLGDSDRRDPSFCHVAPQEGDVDVRPLERGRGGEP